MKNTSVKTTSKEQIRMISITAIFAALITVMTAYVCHIPDPVTGGYIHFGDSLIYLAATLLPAPYAFAAGAIGGGLADLLTAPMWTLPTIVIKMLITLPFTSKGKRIINIRNVIAPLIAYVISGTGYYLSSKVIFGQEVAFFNSILGSAVQSLGSGVFFIIFGLVLDKIQFKKRFIEKETY